MKTISAALLAACLACTTISTAAQSPKVFDVDVKAKGAAINPNLYGVFFEDINFGADGGIYAELIKNRSFEFFKPLMGWTITQKPFMEGNAVIQNRQDKPNNPRFLRLKLNNANRDNLTLANEGFRGMGIKKNVAYDFSLQYRQVSGKDITLHIELLDTAINIIGSGTLALAATNDWKKAETHFAANKTVEKATARIWFEGTGELDLDMISLFPQDTWKGRKGGLRADMVQMLADMKPGFVRFPGGCIVEGFDLKQRYRWKNTIGPVEDRQLIINRWNFEFAHRPAPDYFQTFGLGFFEYFQVAEDIGAEPLPILNCGMACQFNSAEVVPLAELQPYIQDAMDLIEFANGDVSTPWGKVRKDLGHPAPFELKYLGVGNENWGPQYLERLALFQQAIKTKYPYIKIVASSGTDPEGERFNFLNTALRNMNVEIIDEHFYRQPNWFFANAARYDNYPRTISKVFCGEYAAQSDRTVSVQNENNWLTALAEAAFLTGVERNADVVEIASYAPLFAHKDAWQWRPDMIWVDNLRSVGTTDYQVQKLFSLNKGNQVIPVTNNATPIAGGPDSLYASASYSDATCDAIIKVVNASKNNAPVTLAFGDAKLAATATVITLQHNQLRASNTLTEPAVVVPVTSIVKTANKMNVSLKPYSVNIYRIKTRQ